MSEVDDSAAQEDQGHNLTIDDVMELWAALRQRPALLIKSDIDLGFSNAVCRELPDELPESIDLIIDSNGGSIEEAYYVIKLIRDNCDEVDCVVPRHAKSAATLICLGGDNIVMGRLGELGPLDTQIRSSRDGDPAQYKSALNHFKALEQLRKHALESLDLVTFLLAKRTGGMKLSELIGHGIEFASVVSSPLLSRVDLTAIGESARALEVGKEYGVRVLSRYMRFSEPQAEALLRKLVYEYPSHSFILDVEELNSLGLQARNANEDERIVMAALELMLDIDDDSIIKYFEYHEEEQSDDDNAQNGEIEHDESLQEE